MKNILITGGSSHIGTRLQFLLRDKFAILAPSHKDLDLTIEKEVSTYLNSNQVDAIIHCANHSRYIYDSGFIANNVTMVWNLFNNFPKQIVVLNSGVIYETLDKEYKASQYLIHQLCSRYRNSTELVAYGVYGPGEPKWRFPSYCIQCLVTDAPIIIKKNRLMSWIYVDDLCKIIANSIHYNKRGCYTTITEDVDMLEIALLCERIVGTTVPIYIESSEEQYTNTPNIWLEEGIHMEEGLRKLYEQNTIS